MIVKHLCDQGVTPEEIESCVPWRSKMFSRADGALGSAAFVKAAKVDSGGIRRFFCNDDELIQCNGKTYAVANGWGKRTLQAIQGILFRFPDKGVTCEKHSE